MKKLFFLFAVALLSVNAFSGGYLAVNNAVQESVVMPTSGWVNFQFNISRLPVGKACGLHLKIAAEGYFNPTKINYESSELRGLYYSFSGWYSSVQIWSNSSNVLAQVTW